jgi:competence protein ComEC
LEKPELFESRKEFVWTVSVLVIFILIRLSFDYYAYQEFISKPFYFTQAKVLNSYQKTKNGKSYSVLKLRSTNGLTFYTTSYKKDTFLHKDLRLQIFPSAQISFSGYMSTFYVKSRIKNVEALPHTFKDTLLEKVAAQHKNAELGSFYNGIFFATPIDKVLREKIALLGVSHLVALSGFHLGILWGLIYGLLLLIYKPLQQRYFPYRFALIDIGFVTMVLLGVYLWFVDFPPSLLRSYAMLLVGWVVILMGVKLLSFTFLTTIMLTLIALFPSLLFSLSFWLSISGVFYIFLLLQYSKAYNKWMITLVFIPVGIFMFMLPVVHSIFGITSDYQLLSPLLSLLFIPFYPLVMLLHLLGIGYLFDPLLLRLFELPKEGIEKFLPLWVSGVYMLLSLASIWNKKLFLLTLALAFGYSIYLFAV